MVRAKILSKQRKYSKGTPKVKLKENTGLMDYSPTEELLDEDLIAKAIWECLKDNDYEGVIEVIEAHMKAVNKVKAAKDADLAKSSMYNAFKRKNPTIKTLAKLVHCCL